LTHKIPPVLVRVEFLKTQKGQKNINTIFQKKLREKEIFDFEFWFLYFLFVYKREKFEIVAKSFQK
jgi:hypothetical protein